MACHRELSAGALLVCVLGAARARDEPAAATPVELAASQRFTLPDEVVCLGRAQESGVQSSESDAARQLAAVPGARPS